MCNIQFCWQLETTNSRFWLVNILLWYFIRKRNENDKNTNFVMKNKKKMPKKYIKVLSNIFLWTSHTDLWCNMSKLHRDRENISVSFCQMDTLVTNIELLKWISSQLPLRSSNSGMFSKYNYSQKQPSRCYFQYRCSELMVKVFGKYLWWSAIFSKFACNALITVADKLYFFPSFC